MNLTQKIITFLTLVVLVASGILSYTTYRISSSVLQQSLGETQLEITEQTMDKIDRVLYERIVDVQQISNRRSMHDHLKGIAKSATEDARLKKELNELTVFTGPWDVLMLVNADGTVHQSTLDSHEIERISADNEAFEALVTALEGQSYNSDFLVSELTGKPTMLFSFPVRDEEDESRPMIGAVIGYYSWPVIPEILNSIEAHGMLLNNEGKIIAQNEYFLESGAVQHEEYYRRKENLKSVREEKRTFIASEEESGIGKEVFVAVSPQLGFLNFKGHGWSLVLELPTEVAFAPANNTALFLSGMLIPVLLIFMGAVLILVFYLVVRPIQKLTSGVKKISEGDFNSVVQISSRDEIGMLAEAFNNMTNKINNSYMMLEDRVKEKTAELANKVVEVQRQNKILEDTKVAMMNVLEDTRELQNELQKQKEGVEKEVETRTIELKQEQARLEASINSLSFGFIMTDRNKKIITMNETAKHLLGHPNSAALTREDVIREFTIDQVNQYLSAAINIKAEMDIVMQKRIPMVREITIGNSYLMIRISPIITIENSFQVIGSVLVVENITERKMLERSRDEFFSIASHELRTPLTAIRGNTSLIEQFYGDKIADPEFKEMMDDIHQSSSRLIEIVNDFLNTSRLELGKMKFKIENFSINELIEDVIKEYNSAGSVKMLTLEMDPPRGEIPPVRADRDKVKQVLINLVGNAIKFTEKGRISIAAELDGNSVKVSVTDTGRGISEESRKLLFRKFQQAAESIYTRDTTQGTGLGLYISRLIMEGMGGKIGLERSEVGRGSTFTFWVPVATDGMFSSVSGDKGSDHPQINPNNLSMPENK